MYKLKEELTGEEMWFIDVTELKIDYNMKIPQEDYERYLELINKRERILKNESKIHNNNKNNIFI